MSCFGGGLGADLGGGVRGAVGTDSVGIPSNLLISSGCLGLSGLNLTNCASTCRPLRAFGGGVERPASRGGGGALVGLGGLVRGAGVHGG